MTRGRPVSLLGLLALGACGATPQVDLSTHADEIFGGTADNGDEAVMALIHQMGNSSNACTATTIAKVGASGILLTAGHCVIVTDGMGHAALPVRNAPPSDLFVIPGPDWATSLGNGQYYGVVEAKAHPNFDGNVDSPYDVALVRYVGATASTPVIPAATAAEDKLAVGSTITLVGFGKTETDAMNSKRLKVDRVLGQVAAQQFAYDQTDRKGACQGDSGGPALAQTANGTRVVGVTSFGDPDCTKMGASVRVSPFASFIQSFISGAPAALNCEECTLAQVGPGNVCIAQSAACGDVRTPCGKYLVCANACADQTCINRCGSTQAAGAAAYLEMVKCQCGNACQTVCATNATCMSVGGGTTMMPTMPKPPAKVCGLTDTRPDCASCIQSTCCGEGSACSLDATCVACLANPSGASCAGNVAFSKLRTCEGTCPACAGPAPTSDAGTSPPVVDAGAPAVEAGPPAATEAGADLPVTGGGGDGGGCGCRTGGASPSVTSIGPALLMALLTFARRRRQRR